MSKIVRDIEMGSVRPSVRPSVRGRLVNTLVWEWHELQSSNSKHRFLIWSPWTSSIMHDLDLHSMSLPAIMYLSVTLLSFVNTLVREWLQLETPNQVCRHLLWRPWTSLIMHDLDLLSRSQTTIFFLLVTLLCLVNTLVWEWDELQWSNWKHTFFEWRPSTSSLMYDIELFLRSSGVSGSPPFHPSVCPWLVNTLVWEWDELQSSNWKQLYEALGQLQSCRTLTYFQGHLGSTAHPSSNHLLLVNTLVSQWHKLQSSNSKHAVFI